MEEFSHGRIAFAIGQITGAVMDTLMVIPGAIMDGQWPRYSWRSAVNWARSSVT